MWSTCSLKYARFRLLNRVVLTWAEPKSRDGLMTLMAPPLPVPAGKANVLAGMVALAALVACIGMPVGVWMEWTTLEMVRQWLIVPTLVYFMAGAVFYSSWRKSTN